MSMLPSFVAGPTSHRGGVVGRIESAPGAGWRSGVPGPRVPGPREARADAPGKPCDNQAYGQCTTDPICNGLLRDDYARCREELAAECRESFGCSQGQSCSPGGAGSICCPTGATNCAGSCTNLSTDPAHCGSCTTPCPAGSLCCGGACRNPASDPRNCGACGVICPADRACVGGRCVCGPGLTECGGLCRDLSSDDSNCGACGHACPPGTTCANGVCSPKSCDNQAYGLCITDPICNGRVRQDYARCREELAAECRESFGCPQGHSCSPGGLDSICCPSGRVNCGGTCYDLSRDPAHCGSCGTACPSGHLCCGGVCRNPLLDPQNCGGCGVTCTGGKVCSAGHCVCPQGYTDCAGVCRNLTSDRSNCGSCGTACTGGRTCQGGFCRCPSTLPDVCNDTCTNLWSDVNNCGFCGVPCTGGKRCQVGECVCPAPLVDCGGRCVNLSRDTGNCGACGIGCSAGQGCCDGTCLDVSADVLNCGACGRRCTASCSGERRCKAGACTSPQPIPVVAADPSSGCRVGQASPLAFSQSEADGCVQAQYPTLTVGAPTGPHTFQIWCPGWLCSDMSNVWGLSQGDAQRCIERANGGCTVSSGPCANCGFLSNCGGKCVNRSTDAAHCLSCDNPCPSGTSCVNGRCVA